MPMRGISSATQGFVRRNSPRCGERGIGPQGAAKARIGPQAAAKLRDRRKLRRKGNDAASRGGIPPLGGRCGETPGVRPNMASCTYSIVKERHPARACRAAGGRRAVAGAGNYCSPYIIAEPRPQRKRLLVHLAENCTTRPNFLAKVGGLLHDFGHPRVRGVHVFVSVAVLLVQLRFPGRCRALWGGPDGGTGPALCGELPGLLDDAAAAGRPPIALPPLLLIPSLNHNQGL